MLQGSKENKQNYRTTSLMYFSLASNAGGWVRNVARMGQKKNAYIVLVRISEGKIPLGNMGLDGKIILIWILEK
jgi:hypothetical protein